MSRAAVIGGMALVAAGVACALRGLLGVAFVALAAGFALAFVPLLERALARYGGALGAAVMVLALLAPLAPKPAPRAEPPSPAASAPPTAEPEVTASPSAAPGSSEEVRRSIFRELRSAEERAKREASAAHPDRES